MARAASTDYLQQHTFFLVDVAPISPASLPIFDPFAGFQTCTMPEISLDFETIKEGNWIFDKKVVKSGSVSAITLTRGVSFTDSDFWRWTLTALTGDMKRISEGAPVPALTYGGPSYRRDMLLIHFFNRMFGDGVLDYFSPKSFGFNSIAEGQLLGQVEAASLVTAAVTLGSGVLTGGTMAGNLATYMGMQALGLVPTFEFAPRIPARAYYLHGCIPSRYKAGSDFDASSAAVSIAELEMQVEMMELISFGF